MYLVITFSPFFPPPPQHTDLCQYMDRHPGGLHPDNVKVRHTPRRRTPHHHSPAQLAPPEHRLKQSPAVLGGRVFTHAGTLGVLLVWWVVGWWRAEEQVQPRTGAGGANTGDGVNEAS